MTPATSHFPAILTILLQDEEQVFEAVFSEICRKLHTLVARTVMDARRLVGEQAPLTVIAAGANPAIVKLFGELSESPPFQEHPSLLVFVVNDDQTDSSNLPADLILSLKQIEGDSFPALELHLENAHLRKANALLFTENHRLAEELQRFQTSSDSINFLKNSIVWNVAHELRTPLLQVKSAVALLAEDAVNNPVLVELAMGATTRLEAGVKNITLLNELINESLDTPAFEPVLMGDVVESAIRNLRRSWQHKGHVDRIKVFIPDNLPPTVGDKQRLAIALQLLMDNALKFSKKDVQVNLEFANSKVCAAILDYGIGIPQNKIDKIFDTFYQVDNTTTKRYGGMGIGLAIVRFILERHGSKITVESKVGKGTTFSFELPVYPITPH